MKNLTNLIREDMKPALGVTEPGAIAFSVAKARKYLAGEIQKVEVYLNSGMYKNAYTCGIPNSDHVGNVFAAALGAVAGKAEYGLEALADVTSEDNRKAEEMIREGKVQVFLDHMGSEIEIRTVVKADRENAEKPSAEKTTGTEDVCEVLIRGSHTHIVQICKNDRMIYEAAEKDAKESGLEDIDNTACEISDSAEIHRYTFAQILTYIKQVPIEEISFIREAFDMNLELLKEGLASERTTFAKRLYRENGNALYSDDIRATAQLLCNGAIEARVLGLARPAMSITGSGAHGIIATMPLYALYQTGQCSEEELLRATALSYLVCMYIKEYSGKLSAFCGCGIAAGTGMACGLAWIRCQNLGAQDAEEQGTLSCLTRVLQNMASGLTGMICDGGNQGCTMKGIVAVDAAFRSVEMAMDGICVDSCHGINGRTPEDTMRHMGMIASPGMVKTEETIVEIMQNK